MHRNPNKIVNKPRNYRELVEQISEFKIVVAARLHACIISYSLGIPFVALKWNNKLDFFGSDIGRPEWIIDVTQNQPSIIADKVTSVWGCNYDVNDVDDYKSSCVESIATICDSIISG